MKNIQEQEAKISSRKLQLKVLEENILAIKNEIMNQKNILSRGTERISFNREKIIELGEQKKYLEAQIEQTKKRLLLDEEKLAAVKKEHDGISKITEDKSRLLKEKEAERERIGSANKESL